jgi:UDP-glucose 4-epimerase
MSRLHNFYRKKQILVTGGAGFIGSTLVEKLVELEACVTVIDNFSTGNAHNLEHLQHKIKLIIADLSSLQACKLATQNKSHIFHLAAKTSVQESCSNPTLYEQHNVLATQNLLTAALQNNVERFIFSSSAAVYGDQSAICSETTPLNPQSPYAETKKRCEELCLQFSQHSSLMPIILRYFNVDGSRQNKLSNYSAVIPIFIEKMKQQEPLTLFGDGLQTRDFIGLDEIVSANLLAGAYPFTRPEIINVASGSSITLLDLIKKLQLQLRCTEPKITFLPPRKGDIIKSEADCTKFLNLKKWGGANL